MFFKEFSFEFKNSDDLTDAEIEKIQSLSIKLYPAFKKYYKKNCYYSTIKPQIILLIKKDNIIIGKGKFQWTGVKVGKKIIKLYSFGLLIDKKYHKKGIGTHAIKLDIQKAKKMGADVLFGSSSNSVVDKICKKLGFRILTCKVVYTTPERKRKIYTDNCYVYEFKKGTINKINSLEEFDVGVGPL